MSSPGHTGRPYRRLQQWVYARYDTCYRCGGYVDKSIALVNPRHRWAPSLEHIVPLAQGGDRLSKDNAALSHYGCNSTYGPGGRVPKVTTAGVRTRGRYQPSREW